MRSSVRKNLADYFPLQRRFTSWSRFRCRYRAWLRWPGAARPWMLPMVASSCVMGGRGHAAWRTGCRQRLEDAASRVRHARPQAVKARWSQVLNSSPRTLTAGGRAIHLTLEQRCSIRYDFSLCPRRCFRCQVPASECLMRHLISSPSSCASIRRRPGDFRISSGSCCEAARAMSMPV